MPIKITSLLVLVFLSFTLIAQDDYPYPSLSPKGSLTQVIGNTILHIEYERPSARKRKVFGGLVPWNQVWRTGAGHCTKISVNRDVVIEGQSIPKGTYSLFSIPNPNDWILILNTDTTLYGSSFYNPDRDIARFVLLPEKSHRYYETLNFDIELIPNNAEVYLSWENTQISFSIKTSTDQDIEQFIQDMLLSGKSKNSNLYAGAAEYHLYQGTNLLDAIQLTNQAIEIDHENGWARDLKIKTLEKLKLYDDALAEIEKAIEMIKKGQYENEEYRQHDLNNLEQVVQRIHNASKK